MFKTITAAFLLSVFATLALGPGQARAQQEAKYNYYDDEGPGFNSGNRIMLGYGANIPNQYLGFTLAFARPRTWGLFLEYKMNVTSLDIAPYLTDYSVQHVEEVFRDTLKDQRSSWITVNGGVTRPLNDHLCAYLGLGLSFREAYRQYRDPYGALGDNGYYWIKDGANSTVNLNLTGGLYWKLGRYFYLQLGGDLKPLGLAAGLGLAL
jgi:hypothetical protein